MDINEKISRCADVMKNTYIQKDMNLRLSLLKGKDDPKPKSASFKCSVRMNLMQASLVGAGILLVGAMVNECIQKSGEVKAIKKLAREHEELEELKKMVL